MAGTPCQACIAVITLPPELLSRPSNGTTEHGSTPIASCKAVQLASFTQARCKQGHAKQPSSCSAAAKSKIKGHGWCFWSSLL